MNEHIINIQYNENPFPHLIIDNYYLDNELSDIWLELNFLTSPRKLLPQELTGSAMDDGGNYLKNNHGIFLDSTYGLNRNISNILRHNRKLFKPDFYKSVKDLNFIFDYLITSNKDQTLLSYYENHDFYKPHRDASALTSLQWLYKEPKRFTGGDLYFPYYNNYKVDVKNNRCILFPSCIEHAVSEITMFDQTPTMAGYGRYCISQFISFKDVL
jgi:hypothetical protein